MWTSDLPKGSVRTEVKFRAGGRADRRDGALGPGPRDTWSARGGSVDDHVLEARGQDELKEGWPTPLASEHQQCVKSREATTRSGTVPLAPRRQSAPQGQGRPGLPRRLRRQHGSGHTRREPEPRALVQGSTASHCDLENTRLVEPMYRVRAPKPFCNGPGQPRV